MSIVAREVVCWSVVETQSFSLCSPSLALACDLFLSPWRRVPVSKTLMFISWFGRWKSLILMGVQLMG